MKNPEESTKVANRSLKLTLEAIIERNIFQNNFFL